MSGDYVIVSGVGNLSEGEDKIQGYRVQAKRDILTDNGLLKKGETGYVTAQWVRRMIKNYCGCNGSINWVKFIP
jgi:hypothetical protein